MDEMNPRTENILDFLHRFTVEELVGIGVLRGRTLQLRNGSVDPLIELMKEHEVDRLEYPPQSWYLDVSYDFNNPQSTEDATSADQLFNKGNVFNYQNVNINPYYRRAPSNDNAEPDGDFDDVYVERNSTSFSLEKDLQTALRQNIQQLESGLEIIDSGKERTVEGGRIDITAKDDDSNFVAIELKAGTAQPESIAQLLAYMSSLSEEEGVPVRGILVAHAFHSRVILAARAVPKLQLKSYSYRFDFEDR